MSAIVLPPLHRSARYLMRKVYAASETARPAFGPGRQIGRPGDHWMMEVEAAAMTKGCGFEFSADIIQGRMTRVRIPQPDTDTGAVGEPVVDGAGQSGETISLKGATPYLVVRKGWFLSVLTDDTWYAYQVTAETVTDAVGDVTLPIWPMLLVPHADEDAIALAEPWLEGPLTEGGDFEVGRSVRPGTFTIEQRP